MNNIEKSSKRYFQIAELLNDAITEAGDSWIPITEVSEEDGFCRITGSKYSTVNEYPYRVIVRENSSSNILRVELHSDNSAKVLYAGEDIDDNEIQKLSFTLRRLFEFQYDWKYKEMLAEKSRNKFISFIENLKDA